MAELHIIGELSGGNNFAGHSHFCVFEIVYGSQWTHIEGRTRGSTHVMENHHDGVIWSFPIDVHFTTQSIQGWPKISLQVWAVDQYGRKDLEGYGTCYVPMPSRNTEHALDIATWKPSFWHPNGVVRLYQQVRQLVMGGNPVLRDDSLVHTNEGRYKLHTIAGGTVTLQLNVLMRRGDSVGLKFQ